MTARSFAAASGLPICPATPAIFRTDGLWLANSAWASPRRPRHDAARRAGDPVLRPGADRAGHRRGSHGAQVYGIGEARFDRHFKNGQARQWNFFIERSLFGLDGVDRLHRVGEPELCSNRSC